MLARYKPSKGKEGEDVLENENNTEEKTSSDNNTTTEQDLKSEENKILFERDIAFFNVLDPARLFTSKIKKSEQFNLLFTNETANKDTPFEG